MDQINIRFFGQLAEQFGNVLRMEIPAGGCQVSALREVLGASDEALKSALSRKGVRAVVGDEMVGEDFLVEPGQDVEFFPPLSGG